MRQKKKSVSPQVEEVESNQKALFVGKITSPASKGFVTYLKKHSIHVFQNPTIPKNLYSFQFVIFEDAPLDLFTTDFFKQLAPHLKMIFICTNKKLYEKIIKFLQSSKLKSAKVIRINPDFVNEDQYELWTYYLISPKAPLSYDFAPFYTDPKIKRGVKFSFDIKFSRKKIFLMFAFALIVWGGLFLPSLALSLGNFGLYSRAKTAEQKNIYLSRAESYLVTTNQLFDISKPLLSLFFLSLPSDNFIDFHSKTISFVKRANRLNENMNDFYQAIHLFPDKTTADAKLVKIEEDLVELNKELSSISQNPSLDLPFYREYKKSLVELANLTPLLSASSRQFRQVLSSKKDQTIVVFFYNNMELRPGGGFIGSFLTITFGDWRLRNQRVYDVYEVDGRLTTNVEPPEFISKYLSQPFWYLRDSNISPDFEQNVKTASRFLKEEIDLSDPPIAVAITTTAIQSLLSAIGPIYLPDYKTTINAENFYITTQTEVESNFFPGSTNKGDFLQAIFNQVKLKFTSTSPRKLLTSLSKILDEKQVVIYSDTNEVKKIIDDNGWGGKLLIPQCLTATKNCIVGYLFPIEANVGVNKANFFVKRSLSIEIILDEKGKMIQNVRFQLKNDSPADKYPGGRYKNWLQFYLPKTSVIQNVSLENQRVDYTSLESEYYRQLGMYHEISVDDNTTINLETYTLHQLGDFVHLEYIIQKQIGVSPYDAKIQFIIPTNYKLVEKNFTGLVKGNRVLYNTPINKDRLLVIDLKKIN